MARTKEDLTERKSWRFAVAGIVVLACIALMILPVAATTDSYTLTGAGGTGWTYLNQWGAVNSSVWNETTEITWDGQCYSQDGINDTHSQTVDLCYNFPNCGAGLWENQWIGTAHLEWVVDSYPGISNCHVVLNSFSYNPVCDLNTSPPNTDYTMYMDKVGYAHVPVMNTYADPGLVIDPAYPHRYSLYGISTNAWSGDYSVTYGATPTGYCSFNATPTYGDSPLAITVTDTSTTTPVSWNYTIFDNSTHLPSITSTVKNWQAYLNGVNKRFDFMMNSTGAGGNCNLFYPNYFLTSGVTAVKVYVDVKDITTGNYISNAGAGIYNGTDNSWLNKSAPGGMATFTATGNASQYPLMLGENVMLGASAPGYVAAYPQSAEMDNTYGYYNLQITVPNQIVTIYLIPAVLIPAPNTCNLIVHVTKNDPAHADWRTGSLDFFDATVGVAGTGFSPVTKKTDTSGMANFYNLTATNESFLAVSASDPFYIPQTQNVQCLLNLTANASFSMVMLGETPVPTTGVPVKTTRVPTATVIATGTNPNTGQPLSVEETAALGVFGQLAQVIGTWANVAIGIVSIWLLWILVYEMTGGKTLDKIMKRGRR